MNERERFIDRISRELPACKPSQIDELIHLAGEHNRLCEWACGTGSPNQEDEAIQAEREMPRLEKSISDLCEEMGCRDIFQHDPRGHTVKLRLPSGFVDDMEKTGLCVYADADVED